MELQQVSKQTLTLMLFLFAEEIRWALKEMEDYQASLHGLVLKTAISHSIINSSFYIQNIFQVQWMASDASVDAATPLA